MFKKIMIGLILMAIVSLTDWIAMASTSFTPDRNLDAGLMLRDEKSSPEFLDSGLEIIGENAKTMDFLSVEESAEGNFTYNGGSKYFLGYNLEFILFTLRSVGENVEIWVANDLSYGYANLYGSDVVTQAQVDLLRDEFDSNIYPTETAFFGNEDFHDGSQAVLEDLGYVPEGYYANPEGKKIVLVENIKDESYYQDVPFYVAGFYWSALEYYIDLNIVTIDSYAWFALMPNDIPAYQDFQYSVFGTLAHELQHLIHSDNDPAEENWINEGMADFSQFLCGYGHNWDHVEWFLHFPENSLLIWGDYDGTEILADYGQAYLLMLYMYEHFGKEFIRSLSISKKHGIDSVDLVFQEFKESLDFQELFRRFSIAVAIDDPQLAGGIYGFDTIDVHINYDYAEAFEKAGIPAWGANYKKIDCTEKIDTIAFSGIEYPPFDWQMEQPGIFWSNSKDEIDSSLIFAADFRGVANASLEIEHFFDFEENWDYGFVQVSTDGGKSWTSLANEHTVSQFENPDFPQIEANLPGFTGYSDLRCDVFDLSMYAGKKVHIAFRYMTDAYYSNAGWFIDSISIPEIGYYNDCNSLDGFTDLDRLLEQRYQYSAVFINEKILPNGKVKYTIISVDTFTVKDTEALRKRQLFHDGNNYLILWYIPKDGITDPLPFEFEIIKKK